MYKIVVWLNNEYSEAEEFYVENTLSEEQITQEVNKRFNNWYSYDIW